MKRFHKDQLSAIIKLWYLEASNDLSQDHYHNSHVHRVSSRQLSVLGDKSATRFLLSKPKTSQHLWHFNNFFLHLHQAGHRQTHPFQHQDPPTCDPPSLQPPKASNHQLPWEKGGRWEQDGRMGKQPSQLEIWSLLDLPTKRCIPSSWEPLFRDKESSL